MRTLPRLIPPPGRPSLLLPLLLALLPLSAAGQGAPSAAVLEEIRSLEVEVELLGERGRDPGLVRTLEEIVRSELERGYLFSDLGRPRPGDCCILRLDVRLAGSASLPRPLVGYTMRLELAQPDRLGRLTTWNLLWAGPVRGEIVDRRELELRAGAMARELAAGFTDAYRARFPLR